MNLSRLLELLKPRADLCVECGAMRARLLCPTSDGGARRTCYLCAHILIEHEDAAAEHGTINVIDLGLCRCDYSRDELLALASTGVDAAYTEAP